MPNQNLEQWISRAREAGMSDPDIKKKLTETGWDPVDVHAALNPAPEASGFNSVPAPPSGSSKKFRMNKRSALIIGMTALVVILIGGGVFAYLKGYLPMPFGTPEGDELLIDAFTELSEIDSGKFGFTFEVFAEERSPDSEPIELPEGKPTARDKAKNATYMSDASQLKTALVLYADDNNNTYPDAIDEVEITYISRIPESVEEGAVQYETSSDNTEFTITIDCAGNDSGQGYFKSDGTSEGCTSNDTDSAFDISFFDSLEEFSEMFPSDMSLSGTITAFSGPKDDDDIKNIDGIYTIQGSYKASGSSFSLDAEARIKDGILYAQIREFPTFPGASFLDVSAIEDEWMKIDLNSDDTSVSFYDFADIMEEAEDIAPSSKDGETMRTEMMHLAQKALETDFLTTTIDGKETIDGRPTHKVKITLNTENAEAFVRAYREDAQSRGVDFEDTESLESLNEFLDSLEDESTIKQLEAMSDNIHLMAWIDQAGHKPRKMTMNMLIVPPDDIKKLKDRQFRASIGMTFSDLGGKPKIEVPEDAMTTDELERLMLGISEEEQKFNKQRDAVNSIRSALDNYERTQERYPQSLQTLLDDKPTNSNTNTDQNYFYGGRKTIPDDIFTGEPFKYASTDDNYALEYQMRFPPEDDEEDSGSGLYGMYGSSLSYYQDQYVEGTNTATKNFLSKEAEAKKDTDEDGLSDVEEEEYGTNKYLADSDYDGLTDLEEVEAGSDPTKKEVDYGTFTLGVYSGSEFVEKNSFDEGDTLVAIQISGGDYSGTLSADIQNTSTSDAYMGNITGSASSYQDTDIWSIGAPVRSLESGSYSLTIEADNEIIATLEFSKE